MIKKLQAGSYHKSLDPVKKGLEEEFSKFIDHYQSCSILLSGVPGSGKTTVFKEAIKTIPKDKCIIVEIDCRLYNNDSALLKRFVSLMESPPGTPPLEILRAKGTTLIHFDHFDSIIIKKRQFFLYTLFDAIHTNTIALCTVLSVSTFDSCSNLEKRIRSRLTPKCFFLPKPTLENGIQIINSALSNTRKLDWEHNMKDYFMLEPNYHAVIRFAQQVIMESVNSRLNLALLEDTASSLSEVESNKRLVKGLSFVEMLILLFGGYNEKMKGNFDFTFDSLKTDIFTLLKGSDLVRQLDEDILRFSFDRLVDYHLLTPSGRDRSRVSVVLYSEEMDEIIDILPTEITAWARKWMKAQRKT